MANAIPLVNLLPWREELKQERKVDYIAKSIIAALIGVSISGVGYFVLDSELSSWQEDEAVLTKEIKVLDKQIEEIKGLKEQEKALISRKDIIERLQEDRAQTVILLREMAVSVPDGVLVKSIKQTGQNLLITGASQSNAKVSAFMKSLEGNTSFEKAVLSETKASSLNGRKVYDFILNVKMKRNITVQNQPAKKG